MEEKLCFLQPVNATHRQYEALRAFFVEGLSSEQAAKRFGYSTGSFRVLCRRFRKNPSRPFFLPTQKGPQPGTQNKDSRSTIVALRKQNLSIYDIAEAMKKEGKPITPAMVSIILKQEGFARLPRRKDDERPSTNRPEKADVANVAMLDLNPRRFRTKFGGLFLFLPLLAKFPFDRIMKQAGLPGSKMIPAAHAVRSLLALKLFGNARHSHVMSYVLDEGLSLFAGLNEIPKRAFLTEYSSRIHPDCYPKLMRLWFDAAGELGLKRGVSFDLDFHTIPYHGDNAFLEKHYVSKRSRRQKGMLAFLAQDKETRVFCYANAHVHKGDQNDEIMNFVEFWRKRTGRLPQELVFDSKLTTYQNLDRLNKMGIKFITLRRRSKKMLERLNQTPLSSRKRVELAGVSRIYRNPLILDECVKLRDYEDSVRQLSITELGHEDPTFLLTNYMRRSASKLIDRYAGRMIIENSIADGIDFFHMDALSSAVAMKIDCDLQLTLMASSLYRLFAGMIDSQYRTAKSKHIFRDFIDSTAYVSIDEKFIQVRFQKRAHNPYLLAAGYADTDVRIPWLGNKRLQFVFG